MSNEYSSCLKLVNGYKILPQVIDRQLIDLFRKEIAKYTRYEEIHGIRNVHLKVPAIGELTQSSLIGNMLDNYSDPKDYKLIKAIFFNKNQNNNWSVPWHQDKTIAVKEKAALDGYKNWTVKQGIHHVQPPAEILERIITIRIALENCDRYNGALKIIPRSHEFGILDKKAIDRLAQTESSVCCSMKAGDILIMHPLILHSSPKSTSDRARGTIHLEYSTIELPPSLSWYLSTKSQKNF